jgi:hypothetical protein
MSGCGAEFSRILKLAASGVLVPLGGLFEHPVHSSVSIQQIDASRDAR